jgi:hypothetical protein
MLEIVNVYAVKVNNILTIAGEKRTTGEENIKMGSLLSDGENIYEISGIPFVRYNDIEAMKKNVCFTIRPNDIDTDKLNGKTLKLIQN